MKNIYNIYMIFLGMLLLAACEKEEEQAILTPPAEAPALTASATSLVLTEAQADQEAVSFSWPSVAYGYQAAVQYSLQFDSAGNDFASAKVINMGTQLDSMLTVQAFNTLATQLGFAPDSTHKMEVRMVSEVLSPNGASPFVAPVYSNTLVLDVTPYTTYVEPGYLFVPGAYQGWDPATAASLISLENDGVYQGYVTFPADGLEFKLTPEPNWNVAYGDAGEGKLSADGGNLSVPAAGSYLLEADENNLTWKATPYSWGLIGDATGSWDVDQDMAYDYANGVWTITVSLVPGKIKFRLNDDWGTNYGDDDTGDNLLNAGGADITINEAGTYLVTLNVSDEAAPTYAVTKQ